MLIRNHLLCPYSDCIARKRSGTLRIQVRVNQPNDIREVSLKETVSGERSITDLPYKYNIEVYHDFFCPYCNRPVEVVIDETHSTRYVHLRQAKQAQSKQQEIQPRIRHSQSITWDAENAKSMATPDPEEFTGHVREYETKYKGLDQIYLRAMEDFRKRGLWSSSKYDVDSILRSYLLNWGRMGRVLGYEGCDRISKKLAEMKPKLDKFQKITLSTIDMEQMSDAVKDVYNEMLNAEWKSDKGRTKRVGPTATAKVLHMALPNLFMIWDRRIRNCYGFQDRGREYVRFLANMQDWNKELGTTIEALQKEYGKSCTRLIDEYNWKKCWG